MHRPVCRVIASGAGLALLGMIATPANAQTAGVKEKPPLYKYASYWEFPPAHWREVDKDNASSNQKILAPALADGTLVGYGDDESLVHSDQGFTHGKWWQSRSVAGLMKVLETFQKSGGLNSPLLVSSIRHQDQMFVSRFYNWKAGHWKSAYKYTGTYKLKSDVPDPDAAVKSLSGFYVPVFEKMLADGIVVDYEIDREMIHSTDSPGRIVFAFVMPGAESLDKFRAALGAALGNNSLILPAFGATMANVTPQADFLRVNATYK